MSEADPRFVRYRVMWYGPADSTKLSRWFNTRDLAETFGYMQGERLICIEEFSYEEDE